MSDVSIPELDKAGLRRFGLVTGSALIVVFAGLIPWIFSYQYPLWPWIVGAVLATWALVAPASLKFVYIAWMKLALLLNRVTTPLILGVIFYLLFLPVGLLMRVFSSDPMARKLDDAVDTYRVDSKTESEKNMERPF